MIARRQQRVRHINAGRLHERLDARGEIDIRLLEIDHLQPVEIDRRAAQRLKLYLKADGRRLGAALVADRDFRTTSDAAV